MTKIPAPSPETLFRIVDAMDAFLDRCHSANEDGDVMVVVEVPTVPVKILQVVAQDPSGHTYSLRVVEAKPVPKVRNA